jgi:hypothetical protein
VSCLATPNQGSGPKVFDPIGTLAKAAEVGVWLLIKDFTAFLLFQLSTYLESRSDFDQCSRRGSEIMKHALCSVSSFWPYEGWKTAHDWGWGPSGYTDTSVEETELLT